jgi:hypothetical protein
MARTKEETSVSSWLPSPSWQRCQGVRERALSKPKEGRGEEGKRGRGEEGKRGRWGGGNQACFEDEEFCVLES